MSSASLRSRTAKSWCPSIVDMEEAAAAAAHHRPKRVSSALLGGSGLRIQRGIEPGRPLWGPPREVEALVDVLVVAGPAGLRGCFLVVGRVLLEHAQPAPGVLVHGVELEGAAPGLDRLLGLLHLIEAIPEVGVG